MVDNPAGRCPLTYASCDGLYSEEGLRRLDGRLRSLQPLAFTSDELVREAGIQARKMSIGGVQPKVSAVLRPTRGCFELVSTGGRYILKPQHPVFLQVPENEDLTMRMAAAVGIETPPHGLIWSRDAKLCYWIRRFDRVGRSGRLAVEDFSQLSGRSRDTKYESSLEQVAAVIDAYCTFPVVDHARLFQWVMFGFLTGNEDMHLKNFSILTTERGIRRLSPAYDMVDSTIALEHPRDELALTLRGKRSRILREDLLDYFGRERLSLTETVLEETLSRLARARSAWVSLIDRSFLSEGLKQNYRDLLTERYARLGLV